jgi:inosine-uridine nucleoside N-ribohydrolase
MGWRRKRNFSVCLGVLSWSDERPSYVMRSFPNILPSMLLVGAVALVGCTAFQGNPPAHTPRQVWIDTDPSIEPGGHEVDDGFALVQAFHSPELRIKGMSVVFGNAELEKGFRIAQAMVRQFGPAALEVWPGAAGAQQLGEDTPASHALARALRTEPLTILALGPLTNVGTVLKRNPELSTRMKAIIAVAGRRPEQHFRTGTKSGKPFRDFNFELDSEAARLVLASGVPVILAPWELSSQVWITADDLERMKAGPPAARWLYISAMDWLELWRDKFGVDGFNPFDTLAVAILTSPELLTCDTLLVKIETLLDDAPPDGAPSGITKPYLLVSNDLQSHVTVEYCWKASQNFKTDLMKRLLRIEN